MKEIILKMASPNEAYTFTRLLFKNGFVPYKAIIKYNLGKGLPGKLKRLDQYPLRLEGILNGHEMRVLVTPLAAGCSCDASRALYHILRAADFPVEERDFTTIRKVSNGEINITLLRK